MLTGYFDVVRTDRVPTPAAGCLDKEGAADAFGSDLVFLRVYEQKVMPEPASYAEAGVIFANAHRRPGQRIALVGGNEPNSGFEHWNTDPQGYRAWFKTWRAKVKSLDPSIECWWAGVSPGYGPQAWYQGCEEADGAVLHCYGLSVDELMVTARAFVALHPGVPWCLGEVNYGPGFGRRCDRDDWADRVLVPSLAECHRLGATAFLYFAYAGWRQDDASVGQETSLDARGTRIDDVIRAWQDPPQEVPVSVNVNPPREDLVAYARNAAAANAFPPDLFERQIDQESGFRHWREDGTLLGSSAGAQGIAQIVPAFHDVDLSAPWPSLDYAARWMGELLAECGDVIRPLVHYNGGGGAVAAWERGEPIAESVAYVDAILGYLTVPQFGGPLDALGFGADWIGSACGPIAVAGMARALGLEAPVADVLRSAPAVGWTPEGGMNGPPNLAALLRRWRMDAIAIGYDAAGVVEHLRHGRPVIVSTAHHYYLAQRPSRTDDDLLVGNSGMARRGGGPWMSLDRIAALDGGVNALFTAERMADAVPAVSPVDDALNNLFDLTLQTDPQPEERRRSAQLAIDVVKKALEVA